MLRIYFILFFYFFISSVQASDPFDKHQRNVSTNFQKNSYINNVKNIEISVPNCMKNKMHQAADIPFSELILIGVIESKERKKALFVDEKEHFFSISIGEIVSKENLILKDIHLDHIDLQGWENNQCLLLEPFTVRL